MANNNGTPSRTRNFFGRIVDGLLPGSQYNRSTGNYSNIGSGIAGLVGDALVPGAGTLLQGKWENRNGGDPGPITTTDFGQPNNPGMSVGNIGGGFGGIGALNGGGYGPSPFSGAGYGYANPQGQNMGQIGGFANGIFNGGQGNFGPTPTAQTGVRAGGGFMPAGAYGISGDAARGAMDGLKGTTASGYSGGNSGNLRGHLYEK